MNKSSHSNFYKAIKEAAIEFLDQDNEIDNNKLIICLTNSIGN